VAAVSETDRPTVSYAHIFRNNAGYFVGGSTRTLISARHRSISGLLKLIHVFLLSGYRNNFLLLMPSASVCVCAYYTTWVFRRLYRSIIITCISRINLCTECKFFINPEDPTLRCNKP